MALDGKRANSSVISTFCYRVLVGLSVLSKLEIKLLKNWFVTPPFEKTPWWQKHELLLKYKVLRTLLTNPILQNYISTTFQMILLLVSNFFSCLCSIYLDAFLKAIFVQNLKCHSNTYYMFAVLYFNE